MPFMKEAFTSIVSNLLLRDYKERGVVKGESLTVEDIPGTLIISETVKK